MLKKLHLITSELANDLGIPAESPVFVSSNVRKAEFCSDCNTAYTPLVYQVGYTTAAQHFHDHYGMPVGGIYSYDRLTYEFNGGIFGSDGGGFIAIMETVGDFVIEKSSPYYPQETYSKAKVVQSTGVHVREIRPFYSIYQFCGDRGLTLSQTEGFLVHFSSHGFLEPMLYNDSGNVPEHLKRIYECDFKVTKEGEVVFTIPRR